MPLIDPLTEEKARKIVEQSRIAIRATLAGEKADTSLLMAESHQLRAAAHRRLRPVVTDEERAWISACRSYRAQGADIAEAAALANEATGRPVRS